MSYNGKAGIVGYRTMDLIEKYMTYGIPHFIRKFYPLNVVKSGDIVVDAACGYGETGIVLYTNRTGIAKYYGFDIDPKKIKSARHHLDHERFEYHVLDLVEHIPSLPLEKDSVDVVISEETIEHISRENAINFMKSCVYILKDGGHFLLSTPNRYQGISEHLEYGHLYEWSYQEIKDFATKDLGLELIEEFGLGFCQRINYADQLLKDNELYKKMRKFCPNEFSKTLAALQFPDKAGTVYFNLKKVC